MAGPKWSGCSRHLADGTRRQLLDVLAAGPRTTGELCERHSEMTRYGVMAHLKVLEQAASRWWSGMGGSATTT